MTITCAEQFLLQFNCLLTRLRRQEIIGLGNEDAITAFGTQCAIVLCVEENQKNCIGFCGKIDPGSAVVSTVGGIDQNIAIFCLDDASIKT